MPYVCNLSPELQKYAKDVLNEDPATRDEKIEDVRQWINKQPHLKARTDDLFILRFLRTSKFSLEETKQRIDNHYTIRSMIPEWFKDRDINDKNMKEILKLGGMLPLPKVDKSGRRVFVNRGGIIDTEKYSIDDMTRAFYTLYDVIIEEDEVASVMGLSFVMDMEGLSEAHMAAHTPTMAKKSVTLLQNGSPFRPPVLHYLNTKPEFKNFFNMWSSFFNDEMTKMVTVHSSNLSPLFEEIPQEILPAKYGGKEDFLAIIDDSIRKLDEKRDWILEQEKYGVDESKRPGKPKTMIEVFGIEENIKEQDDN